MNQTLLNPADCSGFLQHRVFIESQVKCSTLLPAQLCSFDMLILKRKHNIRQSTRADDCLLVPITSMTVHADDQQLGCWHNCGTGHLEGNGNHQQHGLAARCPAALTACQVLLVAFQTAPPVLMQAWFTPDMPSVPDAVNTKSMHLHVGACFPHRQWIAGKSAVGVNFPFSKKALQWAPVATGMTMSHPSGA
jgi:hypothetical protein